MMGAPEGQDPAGWLGVSLAYSTAPARVPKTSSCPQDPALRALSLSGILGMAPMWDPHTHTCRAFLEM